MSIKITFEWIPKCGHHVFVPTCLWCADLHRVTREAMTTLSKSSTKPTIVAYVDTDGSSVHVSHDESDKQS